MKTELPAARARGGFTLVEIMIVVGIIAIFMTIGIPSLVRGMEKDVLSRAVRDTIEGCKTARDRAILQGVPWIFVIRSEDGGLDVLPAPQEDRNRSTREGRSPKSLPESPYSGFPRKLSEDVAVRDIFLNFADAMEAPEVRVRFFPNGTSDEFTVTYNYKGRERVITLDIVTGLATELKQQ